MMLMWAHVQVCTTRVHPCHTCRRAAHRSMQITCTRVPTVHANTRTCNTCAHASHTPHIHMQVHMYPCPPPPKGARGLVTQEPHFQGACCLPALPASRDREPACPPRSAHSHVNGVFARGKPCAVRGARTEGAGLEGNERTESLQGNTVSAEQHHLLL